MTSYSSSTCLCSHPIALTVPDPTTLRTHHSNPWATRSRASLGHCISTLPPETPMCSPSTTFVWAAGSPPYAAVFPPSRLLQLRQLFQQLPLLQSRHSVLPQDHRAHRLGRLLFIQRLHPPPNHRRSPPRYRRLFQRRQLRRVPPAPSQLALHLLSLPQHQLISPLLVNLAQPLPLPHQPCLL